MSRIPIYSVFFTIFGQKEFEYHINNIQSKIPKNYSDMTSIGWVESTYSLWYSGILNCEKIRRSATKFQTLNVWFVIAGAYMLAKFDIDAGKKTCKYNNHILDALIHLRPLKRLNIYSEIGFLSHMLQCLLPGEPIILQSPGVPPAKHGNRVKGRQCRFNVNTQKGAPWCT